jgi:hypothetical protein
MAPWPRENYTTATFAAVETHTDADIEGVLIHGYLARDTEGRVIAMVLALEAVHVGGGDVQVVGGAKVTPAVKCHLLTAGAMTLNRISLSLMGLLE